MVREQVADAGEGQPHLTLDGARHEHRHGGIGRGGQAGLPDRRLPDPRLSLEQYGSRPRAELGDQPAQAGELALAPDDPHGADLRRCSAGRAGTRTGRAV
jgi:hypothetical protein